MQETKTFDLDAGVDCLAFVNTLDDRGNERPKELLEEYADVIAFALQTGGLEEPEARQLTALALAHPDDAVSVLSEAIALRELLYRIFSVVAADHTPESADIELLNGELRAALGNVKLLSLSDAIEWSWLPGADLHRPLWPIVQSAADLLTSAEGGRVRECAAHDCEWLFFDESRNRSRRWCNMQTCGNRAKVDRFRARQRGAEIVEKS
jgi:predicted RNA-binding Zn ribbon-like protein